MAGDDIDFMEAGAPDPGGPDEDLLETGYRRLPRMVLILLVALIAVVGVGLIVKAASAHSHHPAAQHSGHPTAPSPRILPNPPVADVLGPPLTPNVSDAADVELGANRLYIVRFGTLTAVDLVTGKTVASVHVPELHDYDLGPEYRAVVDDAAGQVWLVREGGVIPARAIAFDSGSLRRLVTAHIHGTVQAAAVLNGRVYLATADGVRELSAHSATTRLVPTTAGFVGYIAADPTRGRLLVMNAGFPTVLTAMRSNGQDRTVTQLPFGGGQLAVTRGDIWAAGFGTTSAVVVRLDPTTLAPTVTATGLSELLGPGAQFVATGSHVVWVRGGDGSDDLWCMDATTGAASQRFPDVAGPVTSLDQRGPVTSRLEDAYVAPEGVVFSLRLAACPG